MSALRFAANRVVVQQGAQVVSFGCVDDDERPTQALQLSYDDDEARPLAAVWLELNGQANVCDGRSIERVAVDRSRISFHFALNAGLFGGAWDDVSTTRLDELVVEFALDDEQFENLALALSVILRDLCASGRVAGIELGAERKLDKGEQDARCSENWALMKSDQLAARYLRQWLASERMAAPPGPWDALHAPWPSILVSGCLFAFCAIKKATKEVQLCLDEERKLLRVGGRPEYYASRVATLEKLLAADDVVVIDYASVPEWSSAPADRGSPRMRILASPSAGRAYSVLSLPSSSEYRTRKE